MPKFVELYERNPMFWFISEHTKRIRRRRYGHGLRMRATIRPNPDVRKEFAADANGQLNLRRPLLHWSDLHFGENIIDTAGRERAELGLGRAVVTKAGLHP